VQGGESRASEMKPNGIPRVDWGRERRSWMREESKRGADESDDACADEPVSGCLSGIGVLRSNEADDDAAGDHAGDPCGVEVALWSRGLRGGLNWHVQIDAEHVGLIDAEACAGGLPGGLQKR
jgi:hypothetical protein